jgi:hypothetical protein
MKSSKIILGLFIFMTLTGSAAFAQQTFTQTVTAKNRSCNSTCTVLDIEESVNPTLIIFVTPVLVNGINLNPHPIGAYYMYQNKWSVFNLDGTAMTVGAKFNVEYYEKSDANHFVYAVAQQSSVSYIDHAGLNNNPNAQIQVFPTSPRSGGALFNRSEIKIRYDASVSKWGIANNSNANMPLGTAYNIMFSGDEPIINNPIADKILNTKVKIPVSTTGAEGGCNCDIPTSLPPNGNAGGDLGGVYPNPSVQKLQGNPVSNDHPPVIGEVLKWNGSAWEPGADNVATAATTTPSIPVQAFFKQGNQTTPEINDEFPMIELSHIIVLTKRSRLIISATVNIEGHDAFFMLFIKDNSYHYLTKIRAAAGTGGNTATICNFIIDKDPGTYTVEFRVKAAANTLSGLGTQATANYSSVMVIPL